MRIQTNIFLWGFFAFLVPITSLALLTSYYSQASYHEDVKKNISQNLRALSTEINRRLSADRALTLGLSQAPAVKAFLPVLDKISRQAVDKKFAPQIEAVNRFFEGFQTIIPGSFIIRVIDSQGNSLVKVNHKQRSQPVYDSLQGISYVEQELNNPAFIQTLRALPKADVSTLVLPHNKAQSNLLSHLSLLDNVIPLYYNNRWVGALSLTILGEDIDKILNHAIRPFSSNLLIVESNPELKSRNGLILYADAQKLLFSHVRPNPKYLQQTIYKDLLDNINDEDNNLFRPAGVNDTLHYIVSSPYPDHFINWIIGVTISNQTINQPYEKIRLSIWTIAAFTLLFGLLLTHIGAQRVTRTLSALVNNFKNYARGDHQQIATTQHCVDEINDLGIAFNEMIQSLNTAHQERDKAQQMMLQNSKLASIGQMAAGIGHEINNPLNNILSYAKLAIRNIESNTNSINSDVKKRLISDLKSLREETLRASDIVKGIMNFSRQVPPHFTEFDIKDWLNSCITLVQQAANEKNISIDCKFDLEENACIKGDRGQLQQVLVNLLLNAIQASAEQDKIIITVSIKSSQLEICIIDNGCGISDEAVPMIFDPFFTTKQASHGTGLGLSISLGIIQDHFGRLEVTNNDNNNGVTAKIILPLDVDATSLL